MNSKNYTLKSTNRNGASLLLFNNHSASPVLPKPRFFVVALWGGPSTALVSNYILKNRHFNQAYCQLYIKIYVTTKFRIPFYHMN